MANRSPSPRVHHHVQLGIGQLQAGGERNGAAVRGVERIQVDVAGNASGAADAGDDGQVPGVDLGVDQRAGKGVDAGADAAARTPDVRHAVHAQELFDRILDGQFGQLAHRATSMMAFRMSSGRCTLPPACPTKRTMALPAAARSTSRTICPRFSSATTIAFTLRGDLRNLLFGERPGGDQAELADLHALLARHLDGALRHPRGDAVRHHHHVGALDLFFLVEGDLVDILVDLVHQPPHQLVLHGGRHVGIAALVVGQAGDVDVVAFAGPRHVGNQVVAAA